MPRRRRRWTRDRPRLAGRALRRPRDGCAGPIGRAPAPASQRRLLVAQSATLTAARRRSSLRIAAGPDRSMPGVAYDCRSQDPSIFVTPGSQEAAGTARAKASRGRASHHRHAAVHSSPLPDGAATSSRDLALKPRAGSQRHHRHDATGHRRTLDHGRLDLGEPAVDRAVAQAGAGRRSEAREAAVRLDRISPAVSSVRGGRLTRAAMTGSRVRPAPSTCTRSTDGRPIRFQASSAASGSSSRKRLVASRFQPCSSPGSSRAARSADALASAQRDCRNRTPASARHAAGSPGQRRVAARSPVSAPPTSPARASRTISWTSAPHASVADACHPPEARTTSRVRTDGRRAAGSAGPNAPPAPTRGRTRPGTSRGTGHARGRAQSPAHRSRRRSRRSGSGWGRPR